MEPAPEPNTGQGERGAVVYTAGPGSHQDFQAHHTESRGVHCGSLTFKNSTMMKATQQHKRARAGLESNRQPKRIPDAGLGTIIYAEKTLRRKGK